jgi:Cap4 dsDNA endonuclease
MTDRHQEIEPAEWLARHSPSDDAGTGTQSRFRFQHECTARSCIAMLVDDSVVSVVCEEHEDFVVIYADQAFELVSVKHRENSQGPWTFGSLCTDGGVKHLYGRWLATGCRARCRVMTNAGLKPGTLEAGPFVRACHSRDPSRIVPFSVKLAEALGTADYERAGEFAVALSVESDLPDRRHIAAVNVRDFFWPVLEPLGVIYSLAEPCYQGVLSVIATANRDQVGERVDLYAALLDPGRFDEATQADRRIRRRTITRHAILDTLQQQARPEASLVPPGQDATPAPSPSRLQRKLDAGGLGPTVVNAAIQLRASWYAFESARRASVPGGDPAFEELRLRVQELAGLSESRMDRSAPYGAALHLDLRETVTPAHLPTKVPFALDDQLLQGLVFQLTDECKVWFSEVFELGEA